MAKELIATIAALLRGKGGGGNSSMEKQASTMLQHVRDRAGETAQAKGEVLQREVGKGLKTLSRDWNGMVLKKVRHLHALRPEGLGGFLDLNFRMFFFFPCKTIIF